MVFDNFKTQVFNLLQCCERERFCASYAGEVSRGGAMRVYHAIAVYVAADNFNFHDVPVFLYSFPAGYTDGDCGFVGLVGVSGDKLN